MNRVVLIGALGATMACRSAPPELVPPQPAPTPAVETKPRESFVPREPRLIPAESLIRTYTAIFGDLIPPEARVKYDDVNKHGKYFGWDQHLSALGLPDYTRDLPRTTQTNTIMVAAFERLGTELCDRAAVREMGGPAAQLSPDLAELVQVKAPPVFDFPSKPGPLTEAEFRPRFDVLHRTFLGYPAELAPPERVRDFHALYTQVESRHAREKHGPRPFIAAWSAVCQGLVRHPEFHHY